MNPPRNARPVVAQGTVIGWIAPDAPHYMRPEPNRLVSDWLNGVTEYEEGTGQRIFWHAWCGCCAAKEAQ